MNLKHIKDFLFTKTSKFPPKTDQDWEVARAEYAKHYPDIEVEFLKKLDAAMGSKTVIVREEFSLFAWVYHLANYFKKEQKPDVSDDVSEDADSMDDSGLWINKEVAISMIEQEKDTLKNAPAKYRKDRDVVLAAINVYAPCGLRFADETLQKNRELVIAAVKQHGFAIEYADESFQKDREVALLAALSCAEGEESGMIVESYIDAKFKKDKAFMLEVVSADGSALYHADESLKKDKEVVFAAAKNNGISFMYADESLKADRDFVLKVVNEDGTALQFARDELKKDKEIVLACIKKYSHFIHYADDSMCQNEDVLKAIEVAKKSSSTN